MDSVVQVRTHLLVSDFGSSTRGERHNSYYANHPQVSARLAMSKISVGRDPKNPSLRFSDPNSTRCLNGRNSTVSLHGPISTPNSLFFKIPKFSGLSLPGMKSSTLQPHFLSGGLLWQWWLLYLLRASVNCTNWLCKWTLNPNSSKPKQTEW